MRNLSIVALLHVLRIRTQAAAAPAFATPPADPSRRLLHRRRGRAPLPFRLIPSESAAATTAGTAFATADDNVDGLSGSSRPSGAASSTEYAALLPGHAVRIRVGDVTASRKAWKKRRRASSPVLIPCSVLGTSRERMVRRNVEACLMRFGEEEPAPAGGPVGKEQRLREVVMTTEALAESYRRRMGGSLEGHAAAILGDDGESSVDALLRRLFDDDCDRIGGESADAYLAEDAGGLVLRTGMTRRRARSAAAAAGFLQFRPEDEGDGDDGGGAGGKMIHTGIAKVQRSPPSPSGKGRGAKFSLVPLGAALRIAPSAESDVDGETTRPGYKEGDELNVFVYSYDDAGDNGSPLLTLSLDDPRAVGRGGGPRSPRRIRNIGNVDVPVGAGERSVEHDLAEVSPGDGPYAATVAAASPGSNAAFVDCGVGRKRGKKHGGGVTRVLGMLRSEDAADEPELRVGDELSVYIKAVFPQSGRFMVTTDPTVKTRKARDFKNEREAGKRRERLSDKFGEDEIIAMVGTECGGVVRAKSKTGDWYYVQPIMDDDADDDGEGSGVSLPVGVASFEGGEDDDSSSSYEPGDRVRVRLEGIDESRGQLALTLLAPTP